MFELWMLVIYVGAGSGIGRAACQVLSREGATVIAADKNYEAAVETIKKHTALAPGGNGKYYYEIKKSIHISYNH